MSGARDVTYYWLFAKSALWTISVELAILFVAVRFWFKVPESKVSNGLLLFAGVFGSAGTLPWLWFVLPRFFPTYVTFLVVGEMMVFAVEAVFYRVVLGLGWGRAALLSLVCNLASFGLGMLSP
ncbi:MAG: hypothetical protein AB9869_35995 [Verrucomicrobiia bacterium]